MELAGTLDVLSVIIAWCQGAMATTAALGMQLALTLWTATILFTLAIMIGGGAAGAGAALIRAIIYGGIVIGGLAMWPTVVNEMYATVNEMSRAISGRDFNPMATVERGWDLYMNALWHNMTWSMLLPWNWASAGTINAAGMVVFVTFLLVALIVAAATVMFFIAAVVAPILLGLMFVPALAGFGLSGVGMVLSATVYMIVFSVIISAGEAAFVNATIPGPGESVTLGMLGQTVVAALAVLFMGWYASSWAATMTRGAAGGTGMNAALGFTAGVASSGLRGAGAASAGAARGGSAAAGSGTMAGNAAAGASAPGSARSGAARAGNNGSGAVGTQTRP